MVEQVITPEIMDKLSDFIFEDMGHPQDWFGSDEVAAAELLNRLIEANKKPPE